MLLVQDIPAMPMRAPRVLRDHTAPSPVVPYRELCPVIQDTVDLLNNPQQLARELVCLDITVLVEMLVPEFPAFKESTERMDIAPTEFPLPWSFRLGIMELVTIAVLGRQFYRVVPDIIVRVDFNILVGRVRILLPAFQCLPELHVFLVILDIGALLLW